MITDTAIVDMIQESLTSSSGCLFPYRDMTSGETDFDGIFAALSVYWSAVRDTFPDAWGKPPAGAASCTAPGSGRWAGSWTGSSAPSTRGQPDAPEGGPGAPRADRAPLPLDRGNWEGLGAAVGRGPERSPATCRNCRSYLVRVHLQAAGGTAMKFFFPDSQDQVDPGLRLRHRGTVTRSGSASATTATPTRCSSRRRSTGCWCPRPSSTGPLARAPASTPSPNGTGSTATARQAFFRLDDRHRPRLDDHGRLRRLLLRHGGATAVHASTRSSTSTRLRVRPRHLRRPRHPRLRARVDHERPSCCGLGPPAGHHP